MSVWMLYETNKNKTNWSYFCLFFIFQGYAKSKKIDKNNVKTTFEYCIVGKFLDNTKYKKVNDNKKPVIISKIIIFLFFIGFFAAINIIQIGIIDKLPIILIKAISKADSVYHANQKNWL